MVRAGELPKRRTMLRAYLTGVREGLIADLAGSEERLSTVQAVLVDGAISLLSILRCVEEHTRETGVFKGRELAPVLGKSYCTYSAELRRVLESLGVKEKVERILTPAELAAIVVREDRERERKARRRRKKAEAVAELASAGLTLEAEGQGEGAGESE